MHGDVSYLAALIAGLISFLSPCVLPLVPPYLVYLAGTSLERFADREPEPQVKRETVIAAALLGAPVLRARGIEPVYALAIGVMVGGVLQLALQLPALAAIGMLPRLGVTLARLRAAWAHPGVRRILMLMAPAALAYHSSGMVETALTKAKIRSLL